MDSGAAQTKTPPIRAEVWRMIERFDIRQDDCGWTVLDAATKRPIAIMGVPQVGLDVRHALDLVDVLDRPAARERRSFSLQQG